MIYIKRQTHQPTLKIPNGEYVPVARFLNSTFFSSVYSFVLANARIVDYPIVYCNEGFSRLTGYSRVDIMQKSGNCAYFHGEQTTQEMRDRLIKALDTQTADQIEMLFHKKNHSPVWLLVCVAPVRNEQEEVVLFLLAFRDITPLKTPFEDEETAKGEQSRPIIMVLVYTKLIDLD
ncbi:hypothetical protein EG68_00419 [Paragonimus skrjabini miyazakii]|uniref:LOV domain-containing protein n=1 Tax=Paragonimus skrjabini miyazakii TaxID=59628 RepID=A0A8S9ZAH0_9TREM|nr:hypothetical protein EG68_00419 [Paragonimus skrjabini miyazakii]